MKALFEHGHGLSLRTFVRFILPDKGFHLLGQEAADGGCTPRRENSHLLERLSRQAYGHVLFGHTLLSQV